MKERNVIDLSIQISLNGLCFCILNRVTSVIELLLNHQFDKRANPFEVLEHLKTILAEHPQLNQTFQSVLVIHQNELSNLVPKSLFDEKQSADYLKFNSKILKSDFISHDDILSNDAVNVYVPFVNINNFIFDKFGVFVYKHASTILIDKLLQQESESKDDVIYININQQHFELIGFRNGKLLIYNSFEFSTKEDVIYYVLFTIEQLRFNPETLKLKLMGTIENEDELFTILYTYIRSVEFYKPTYSYKIASDLAQFSEHDHAIILNSF